MAVVIFGVWNVPLVRNLINPLKLFTIGWHELCHIIAVRPSPQAPCTSHLGCSLCTISHQIRSQAVLTNATILKITIDPTLGGCTIVEGGRPLFILSAGYIGSTLLGAFDLELPGTRIDFVIMTGGLLVLGGWDLLVAKIMSWVIGVGLVMPLVLVRDKL